MSVEKIQHLASRMRQALDSYPKKLLPIGLASFPSGACGDTSLLLGAYLSENGIPDVQYVAGERGTHLDESWSSHAWLKQGSLIIDITSDQFADAPRGIIISSSSVWHQSFRVIDVHEASFDALHGPGVDEIRAFYPNLRSLLAK